VIGNGLTFAAAGSHGDDHAGRTARLAHLNDAGNGNWQPAVIQRDPPPVRGRLRAGTEHARQTRRSALWVTSRVAQQGTPYERRTRRPPTTPAGCPGARERHVSPSNASQVLGSVSPEFTTENAAAIPSKVTKIASGRPTTFQDRSTATASTSRYRTFDHQTVILLSWAPPPLTTCGDRPDHLAAPHAGWRSDHPRSPK